MSALAAMGTTGSLQSQLQSRAEIAAIEDKAKLANQSYYPYSNPYGSNMLFEALTKAQSQFTTVPKTKEIDRGAGKKPFMYADLADVLEMALPILSRNGLGLIQKIRYTDRGSRLVTKIIHASGQSDEDDGVKLQEDQTNQIFGTSLTYARRYGACAMLGIVSDLDTDGEPSGQLPKTSTPAPNVRARPTLVEPAGSDEVTPELKKAYAERIKTAGKKLDEGLVFVRAKAGVTDTRVLTKTQFDNAMIAFDIAVRDGTFDDVVKSALEAK